MSTEETKASAEPLTLDLNAIVNDAMADISASGFVQETIKKRLQDTTKEIINDLFKEYGTFGKQLKQHISDRLQINFDKLDLASYDVMIINHLQELMDQGVKTLGLEKLHEMMNKMLKDAKDEYKLSELVKEMKDYASEHNDHDNASEVGMIIDRDFSLTTYIYLDPRGDQSSKYRYKYLICVDAKTGEVTRIQIDDKKFDNKTIMSGLYGFDEQLFRLFAHGSKITIDEDEVDLEYPEREDED